MHLRVVRFTDVDPERVKALVAQLDESDGPPPGVKATGLQIMVDADQRTSIVIQAFANDADMRDSEAVFDAMDVSETPGTRASIDRGEVLADLSM